MLMFNTFFVLLVWVCNMCVHLACERHLFESFLTALRLLFRPGGVNCGPTLLNPF